MCVSAEKAWTSPRFSLTTLVAATDLADRSYLLNRIISIANQVIVARFVAGFARVTHGYESMLHSLLNALNLWKQIFKSRCRKFVVGPCCNHFEELRPRKRFPLERVIHVRFVQSEYFTV
jgi:hypothetical protein